MSLERAVAGHRGQHGRVEGGRHLLGPVQAAVGLLAQQGEACAEKQPEEQPENDGLQWAAALARGDVSRLNHPRAPGAHRGQRPQPLRVGAQPVGRPALAVRGSWRRSSSRPRTAAPLGLARAQLPQLIPDVARRSRYLPPVVGPGQVTGGHRVGVRQQCRPARRGRLRRDVHDVARLPRAGHRHVPVDVLRRYVPAAPGQSLGGGHRGAAGVHQLDVAAREVLGVDGVRVEAQGVQLGADPLAKEELRRRLVRAALQEDEGRRGRAAEQGDGHDDQDPAPQHREERHLAARCRLEGVAGQGFRRRHPAQGRRDPAIRRHSGPFLVRRLPRA